MSDRDPEGLDYVEIEELEDLHVESLGAPTIEEIVALAEARAVEADRARRRRVKAARGRRGAAATLEGLFGPEDLRTPDGELVGSRPAASPNGTAGRDLTESYRPGAARGGIFYGLSFLSWVALTLLFVTLAGLGDELAYGLGYWTGWLFR